jgi:ABC-type tungstate transport system substrate-binding protein
MPIDTIGRWLIGVGLVVAAVGVILLVAGNIPFLRRLGQLPGDINYESPDKRVRIWIPIVSSLLVSLVLTLILNLIAWLMGKR